MKVHTGWFSDGYESRYAYWEGVVHVRRFVFILIGIWPQLSRASELALYQVTSVLAMLLHLSVKPFDNRAGELLDEIELYGLSFFQMLVVSLQVVLLANPEGADFDLVTIFFTGAILVCSSAFLCTSVQSVSFFLRVVVTVLFSIMVAFCYMDEELRDAMCFSLIALAYALNALFILWMLWKVLGEISVLVAHQSSRVAAIKEVKAEKNRLVQKQLTDESHRHHKGQPQSSGAVPRALALPSRSRMCLKRLRKMLSGANSGSGALIHFDAVAGDLVLGLHPDTYMNDPSLSAYTRRMLARLGPFLTDEEREFVAMSLHDAIFHIIVECDYDRISVHLLEFLLRYTFASYYQKKILLGEMDDDENADEPKALAWGYEKTDADSTSRSMSHIHTTGSRAKAQFLELFWDSEVFRVGMTAEAFQAQLMQITLMPRVQAEEMLSRFLDLRIFKNAEARHSKEERASIFGQAKPFPSEGAGRTVTDTLLPYPFPSSGNQSTASDRSGIDSPNAVLKKAVMN
jgi:hypothetical protein